MKLTFKTIGRTFIFEKAHQDFPIGYLVDFVINPSTGKFEAAWVKIGSELKIMNFLDIQSWTSNKLIIKTEDALSEPEKSLRLKEIIRKEVPILGAKVWNGKQYIGKVTNFTFDTLSPRIETIIVDKWKWLWRQQRIIARTQISKITHQGIFIVDNSFVDTQKTVKNKTLEIPEVD